MQPEMIHYMLFLTKYFCQLNLLYLLFITTYFVFTSSTHYAVTGRMTVQCPSVCLSVGIASKTKKRPFLSFFYSRQINFTLSSWRRPIIVNPLTCCHMGTAMKHPVPDSVKPSFVIFDIRALWRAYPVWHRTLYSCTHMATVGVNGLIKLIIYRHIKIEI